MDAGAKEKGKEKDEVSHFQVLSVVDFRYLMADVV